jgi:hypothetical protein
MIIFAGYAARIKDPHFWKCLEDAILLWMTNNPTHFNEWRLNEMAEFMHKIKGF